MPDATRARAAEVAAEVAERLVDPRPLPELTAASARAAGQPDPWQPVSLTTGHPGVAILHAAAGRPDRAHAHLAAALAAVPATSTTSIFHGYGALVAATAVVAGATGGYAAFLERGHRWLAAQALAAVREQRDRWSAGHTGADDRWWDTICGTAGAGRVLLAAVTCGAEEHRPAVEEILSFLVELILPRPGTAPSDPGALPGWWIPADDHGRHPPGGADTGLAHGISGPLALLAVARSAGITVAGQDTAIRHAAGWLLSWRTRDHRWPGIIGPDDVAARRTTSAAIEPSATRTAWCYGAGGVARTLQLAGDAVGDDGLRAAGAAALDAMAAQNPETWQLWGPTVCHGYAGLLAVARTMRPTPGTGSTGRAPMAGPAGPAHVPAVPAADRVARTAAALALAGWDERAPWGFAHTHLWGPSGPVATDIPGLLVGAAGTALALQDWSRSEPAPAGLTWPALLMLN